MERLRCDIFVLFKNTDVIANIVMEPLEGKKRNLANRDTTDIGKAHG